MSRITLCHNLVAGLACVLLAVPAITGAPLGVADDSSRVAIDLLPDIIVREADLYDNDVVDFVEPGRTHLRLSNGTANIGEGKLHLYGVFPDNGDGTQDVMQRVFRDDSTFYDRTAGQFVFHEGHDHIHFDYWAEYRIREVTAGNGVGPIVAFGEKTSFCILDLGVYDNSLPGYNDSPEFSACNSVVQGLSIGWIDVYSKGLPGQNIDITDVPDGLYWLESEVDPRNRVLEADETNNITRVLVTIGESGETIAADAYEPNDNLSEVVARPAGGPNSPNLGPCNPERIISGLSIHEESQDDYFRFYVNSTGTSADFIKIEFGHALGDLDMELLDNLGNDIESSTSTTNEELISLDGVSEGWYYAHVYGFNGAVNPDYTLTVNPPANSAPSVTVTAPPIGDTTIYHGIETYQVTWNYSDPESDLCWVNVYVNTIPAFDGNELLLPTSVNLDADLGLYVVNSSYLDTTTYYVYCQISDGGTTGGDWSDGTLTVAHQPAPESIAGVVSDTAGNPVAGVIISVVGHTHADTTNDMGWYSIHSHDPGVYDVLFAHDDFADTTVTGVVVVLDQTTPLNVTMTSACGYLPGDVNGNGEGPDVSDLTYLVNYLFLEGPAPTVAEAADFTGDATTDVSDLTYLVNALFLNGPMPVCL